MNEHPPPIKPPTPPTLAPPANEEPSMELLPTDEQLLLHFLGQRQAQCPVCDYNLHRLTRPVCPECGHALQLHVRTSEPFQRIWTLLIVNLALAAGPGIFVVIVTLAEGVPTYGLNFADWYAYLYTQLAVILAIAALVARRPFCRLPKAVQAIFATVAIMANLAVLVWAIGVILFHW